MLELLAVLTVLLLCAVALAWFVYLERQGRTLDVLVFLGWLLVVESVLYHSPNEVLLGLFHPEIGGLSFRVFDLLIPAAVVARIFAGVGTRMSVQVLCWFPFLAWLAAAGLLGVLRGNNLQFLTFEAKLGVYLLLIPLAATIPTSELLRSAALRRLLIGSAVAASVLMVTQTLGLQIAIAAPLVPVETLGQLGSDIASVFCGMGLACVTLALCSERHRAGLLCLATPLVLCPFAAGQRAALLGLAVSVLAIALLLAWSPRRLRTTPTEMGIVAVVGLALLLVPVFMPAVGEARTGSLPFERQVLTAFTSRAKQLSSEDRVNQWEKARLAIGERPVFGSGLGATYVYWDPGFFRFREAFLTHNVVGDLLYRTGVIGLLLFAIPVLLALGTGVRGWLGAGDRLVAAVALGCTAVALGLLAKGLVESIFEKYRLTIFLAILIGLAIGAGTGVARPDGERRPAL